MHTPCQDLVVTLGSTTASKDSILSLNSHLTPYRCHRGALTPVASATLGPSALFILRNLTRQPSRLDSSRTLWLISWQVAQEVQSLDNEPEQNSPQKS